MAALQMDEVGQRRQPSGAIKRRGQHLEVRTAPLPLSPSPTRGGGETETWGTPPAPRQKGMPPLYSPESGSDAEFPLTGRRIVAHARLETSWGRHNSAPMLGWPCQSLCP